MISAILATGAVTFMAIWACILLYVLLLQAFDRIVFNHPDLKSTMGKVSMVVDILLLASMFCIVGVLLIKYIGPIYRFFL